jgi:quercetin dioxygenase-like cupin family protein
MTNFSSPKLQFDYLGVALAVYRPEVGGGLPTHSHDVSHALFCTSGSCLVRVGDKEVTLTPESRPIVLPALIPHEIEALENDTVFITMIAK